ncbi:MAG: cytochrome P450 [Bacteroidota bacterium]
MAKSSLPTTGPNFLKTGKNLTSITLETLLKWQKELGDLYYINMGPMPGFYATADLEMVEYILQKEQKRFKKSTMYDGLALMTGKGLVTNEGDHWLKQRRLAAPAFHKEYLANVFGLVMEEVQSTLDQMAATSGEVIHWEEEAVALTMNVVVKGLIGSTLEGDTERFSDAAQLGLAHAMRLWKDPFFKYTQHLSGAKKKFDRENEFLGALIEKFIAERRQTGNTDKWDVMAMFMAARDEDSGEGMSDEQLKDEIMTMFLGGHETSSHTLSWGMLRLKQHPEVVEKLRAEVDRVAGTDPLQYEHLPQLRYTAMVVNEMMRIDSAVWTIARTSLEAITFPNGQSFPANTQFMIPIYAIHRNPKYWDQPDQFIPERFENGVPKGSEKLKFMPFGAGPRMCIGWNFAMMELVAILASLVRRFDIEVLTDEASYEAAITLAPTSHIDIKVKERLVEMT